MDTCRPRPVPAGAGECGEDAATILVSSIESSNLAKFNSVNRAVSCATSATMGSGYAPSRASSIIKSEPLSAIMKTAAWVLPEIMPGMIDASTTRKPSSPCTFNR